MGVQRLVELGDARRRVGDVAGAWGLFEEAAGVTEVPAAAVCVRLAQLAVQRGDVDAAVRWAVAVVDDGGGGFGAWRSAAAVVEQVGVGAGASVVPVRRSVRVALVGSQTTQYLASALRLAARRRGVAVELWEAGYGQYEREVVDPASGLYAFAPQVVVMAVDESAVRLEGDGGEPAAVVAGEVARWVGLWETVIARTGAQVVQFNAVVPFEEAWGHVAVGVAGSRGRMVQAFNAGLADAAPRGVSVVDVDRLAGRFGKERWVDPRYWHLYKLPVALEAVPVLARHTAAVVAAQVGLTRKCLAVDLDNTLWGGVVGEEGVHGIAVDTGPTGSPFLAVQSYLLRLKERGVVLAVCSKNDEAVARAPFEQHPDMRLGLDDFAVFLANWESKSTNLRRLAATLNIGLDAIAFVDDNPFERGEVRRLVPEVDVISLPDDPALYVRALSDYTGFETAVVTSEDRQRTVQYRARAQAVELQRSAASLDEYYRDLRMQLLVRPFEPVDVPRIVQLLGKTNQFNLTTRRHSVDAVEAFAADPDCVDLAFRVRDRFADHGLIGVVVAHHRGAVLDIDTWLMSCRVIGRGVEDAMLDQLLALARDRGATLLRGTYIPTAKNGLVADVFPRLGFELHRRDDDATTVWHLAVADAPAPHHHLAMTDDRRIYDAAA